MNWKKKHKQLHEDFQTLFRMYGSIDDFCGAWCNCDVMFSLLSDPTYKNSCNYLEHLIGIYFQNRLDNGGEINTMDPDVYEIGMRYNLLGASGDEQVYKVDSGVICSDKGKLL